MPLRLIHAINIGLLNTDILPRTLVNQNCPKNTFLPGVVAYACNLSLWKVEAGGSSVKGHLLLYCELDASQIFMRPSQKQTGEE